MSEEITYLTAEGAKKMREELEYLKSIERKDIAERLHEAVQMGDLSENADYHATKEAQSFLEGRIQELERILQTAMIIDPQDVDLDVVQVGNRVTIQEGDDPPEVYQLVGVKEANPSQGRISHESPMGNALLGKRVGDEVTVQTPGGQIRLKVLKIEK